MLQFKSPATEREHLADLCIDQQEVIELAWSLITKNYGFLCALKEKGMHVCAKYLTGEFNLQDEFTQNQMVSC